MSDKQYANCRAKYTGGLEDGFGNPCGFTIGKIYEFVDGRCVDDDGVKRPVKLCSAATIDCLWFAYSFVIEKD